MMETDAPPLARDEYHSARSVGRRCSQSVVGATLWPTTRSTGRGSSAHEDRVVDANAGRVGDERGTLPKKAGAKGSAKAGRAKGGKAAREEAASVSEEAVRKVASEKHAAAPGRMFFDFLTQLTEGVSGELSDRVERLRGQIIDVPARVGKGVSRILFAPENPKLARQAGAYLRELRELAGLTLREVSEAIELKDQSLLRAVENGTATLSFELILRLAALLARHDPVPFVLRFTRSYDPEIWEILQDWGLGRLSLQYEREREFINVYRRHDAARKLSDEGFSKVLDLTRAAFDMSLHFVAEQEEIEDEVEGEDST